MSTKEQRQKWAKQRIDALKAMKRCVCCGKQDAYTLVGRWRCAECSEKNAQYAFKWQREHPKKTIMKSAKQTEFAFFAETRCRLKEKR